MAESPVSPQTYQPAPYQARVTNYRIALIGLATVLIATIVIAGVGYAINLELNRQNTELRSQIDNLQSRVLTLQNRVANLQSQIDTLKAGPFSVYTQGTVSTTTGTPVAIVFDTPGEPSLSSAVFRGGTYGLWLTQGAQYTVTIEYVTSGSLGLGYNFNTCNARPYTFTPQTSQMIQSFLC